MTNHHFSLPPIQWRKVTRILDFTKQPGFVNNQTDGYVVNVDVEPPVLNEHEPSKERNDKPSNGVANQVKSEALVIDQSCFQLDEKLTTKEKQSILNAYVPITETSPSKWLTRKVALLTSPEVRKAFNSTFERDAFYIDEETGMIVPDHRRVAEAESQFSHSLESDKKIYILRENCLPPFLHRVNSCYHFYPLWQFSSKKDPWHERANHRQHPFS
jgi:hypothetical protein